jgi:hypothetical protein
MSKALLESNGGEWQALYGILTFRVTDSSHRSRWTAFSARFLSQLVAILAAQALASGFP